jgi:guanylate kinase
MARAAKGRLFVLSGPSGSGKDTVLARVLGRVPSLTRCVTRTTRVQRAGEVNGFDYEFVSEQEFQRLIDAGDFLEWALVHGNYYGTPLSGVRKLREKGRDVVLKIDVQGAEQIRRRAPDAITIFVLPPSKAELESRLRGRHTDSEEAIERRLADALREMEESSKYDYVVVNDDLGACADELTTIFTTARATR